MTLLTKKISSSLSTAKHNIQSKLGSEQIKMVEINKLKFDKSQPIIATKEGYILDGNSRYMAAVKAKIKFVPVVYKEFVDKTEALKYELHLQLDRRNLCDSEIFKMFRKLEELKNQTKQTGGATSDFTDSKLSEQLKCSERQVQKLRELTKRADNETLRKVETGELSINKAYVKIKSSDITKEHKLAINNNEEFCKGVKFALDEISKGKSSEEIISALQEMPYGK